MPPALHPESAASHRLVAATALGSLMILAGLAHEAYWLGQHAHLVACAGVAGIALLGLLTLPMQEVERRRIEIHLCTVLVLIASLMVAMPDLLAPEAAQFLQPGYRGTRRWRGWLVDPNNTAIVLVLAIASAWHLWEHAHDLRRLRHGLVLVGAALGIHLGWTFSRTGWLLLALLVLMKAAARWPTLPLRTRQWLSFAALLALVVLPGLLAWGRESEWPYLRRLCSASNVFDAAWGNRVHTAGASLQAMLDRPWTGWGWNGIGDAMELLYKPAFLNRTSAFWLNDYARTGAALGIPALATLVALMAWAILQRAAAIARTWAAILAVAMFFQGVLSIPATFALLCIAIALAIGAAPPWRRSSWNLTRRSGFSSVHLAACAAALFTAAWFGCAWRQVPFTVAHSEQAIAITPKANPGAPTIVLETSGEPMRLGPMARAIAAKGLRALVTSPQARNRVVDVDAQGVWVIGGVACRNVIPSLLVSQGDPVLNGTLAAQHVVEAVGGITVPSPDRPTTLRPLLACLLAIALAVVAAAGASCCPRRVWAASVATTVVSMIALSTASHVSADEENRRVADWAAQMRRMPHPAEVWRDYVLNPRIAPGFTLERRDEVWATFHQVSGTGGATAVAAAVRRALVCQFTVIPGDGEPRDFRDLWATRVGTYRETCLVFAAVLRAVNIASRICDGAVQVWDAGEWRPALRLPEAGGR